MSTADTPASHRIRRHLGVAVIGAALVTATACGGDGMSIAADLTAAGPTTAPLPAQPVHSPASTTAPTAPSVPVASAPTDERPTAEFDGLIGVEGHRVHVRCTGSGAVTVVLISGFEAGSAAWAAVEPTITAHTRVCSYDRPGTGTSDPATAIATFRSQAHDLHDVLATVGEPGPYVVVGHSFGGAEAVSFASAFPDEVTGLVLVDTSPVTWPDALCAVADDGSDAATMLRDLCAGWSDPTRNTEHLDVFAAFADVTTINSLGALPTTAITAIDRRLPAGLAAGEVERLTDVWDQGQRHWGRLSSRSRLVPVADTSHDIQLDHPDLVIDEIVRLLPSP